MPLTVVNVTARVSELQLFITTTTMFVLHAHIYNDWLSYINIFACEVCWCWVIISEWLNRITVHNRAVLYDAVENRREDQPLVTVSNHRSCFDDPVLFGNGLHSLVFCSVHFPAGMCQEFSFQVSFCDCHWYWDQKPNYTIILLLFVNCWDFSLEKHSSVAWMQLVNVRDVNFWC